MMVVQRGNGAGFVVTNNGNVVHSGKVTGGHSRHVSLPEEA